GRHAVHGVAVRPDATLAGTSTFELADDGLFLNEGRVAPGASIGTMSVDGNFRQNSSGQLQVEFNPAGQHDVLAVSGTVDLAGTLEMTPVEGWYGNAYSLQAQPVAAGGTVAGGFEAVTVASVSPTLTFTARPLG